VVERRSSGKAGRTGGGGWVRQWLGRGSPEEEGQREGRGGRGTQPMSGGGGIRRRAGGGEPSSPSSRFGWFPRVTSSAAGADGGDGWLWLRHCDVARLVALF
jgi:hypothetical protein